MFFDTDFVSGSNDFLRVEPVNFRYIFPTSCFRLKNIEPISFQYEPIYLKIRSYFFLDIRCTLYKLVIQSNTQKQTYIFVLLLLSTLSISHSLSHLTIRAQFAPRNTLLFDTIFTQGQKVKYTNLQEGLFTYDVIQNLRVELP